MKGLIKFFLILGAVIFFLFSVFTFLISVNIVNLQETQKVLNLWIENVSQLNVGLIGGILALLSLIIGATIFYASFKEKVIKKEIAFGNPLGEVKVSLAAISEFIRKLGDQIDEIKEIKPRVIVGKKGLEIYNRITLFSDSNIPEASDRVQTIVKRYIQDVLGIQDVQDVKVFVEKIVPREVSAENAPKE